MEEQPVAFAMYILSPNSWVTSLAYGVSPQPPHAPENSRSGSFREYYYPKLANHCFINSAVIADSPEQLLWAGIGEVFRSGCTFTRGYGKIFYFQPGHETNGSFYNPYVRRIIQNAVHWCYNDKNRRITLGAPSIEVTLEQARLEGNTGEYLKMWD